MLVHFSGSFFDGSLVNIFLFWSIPNFLFGELHRVSPILSKCCWFELWTCHKGQPIGHFGVSFVFTLVSLLAKLLGFYFMFLIFPCFLASVHLRILILESFSFFWVFVFISLLWSELLLLFSLVFFLFFQVVCISLALMIPSLEIQFEDEGKTLANFRKEETLGDEANDFFSINTSMESVQTRESLERRKMSD